MLPFYWKNGKFYILDQRKLPSEKKYVECSSYKDVARCVKEMVVRGAPAIGIAAGYGVVLGVKEFFEVYTKFDKSKFLKFFSKVKNTLSSTRPTAVNLFWVLNRMENIVRILINEKKDIYEELLKEAEKILVEQQKQEKIIVEHGCKLIKNNSIILTHCNTGGLATGGIGTALGVIIEAYKKGKIKKVYVDETRPFLQGARLTMLELMEEGIPCELITDSMAGYVMKTKKVNYVIVGADRIACNGDVANKIGTYTLSILAKYHNIPFYVVAPTSTIDFTISDGEKIKIEERDENEIKYIRGKLITLKSAKVYNPSFDITPAELITGIVTEKGVFRYPYNFSKWNQ